MRKYKNKNFTNNYPNTKKRKYRKKAGKSSDNNSTKKKKALEKINKQKIRLKRKQEPCPICLEKFEKNQRVETTCGHFFHKTCLQGWCIQKVKKDEDEVCSCPVCNKDLILQTREAKNKIAEKKRLEKKNQPRLRPLQGEERRQHRLASQRIQEEYDRRIEERQRRMEERNRQTQRELAELGISSDNSSDEED